VFLELAHLNLQSFLKEKKQKSHQIRWNDCQKIDRMSVFGAQVFARKGHNSRKYQVFKYIVIQCDRSKKSKIKFVNFMSSLTISPEKFSQNNDF
jgi:hypothetical protein